MPPTPEPRPIVADHGEPVSTSREAEAVATVSRLTKRFGDVVAVAEVTFSLQPRIVTGFLGPNGAGTTTTLRLLLGLAE
ncbi:MAG: hypothetical protein ACRDY5_01850, partial [Acidimicrobiales bacterium]